MFIKIAVIVIDFRVLYIVSTAVEITLPVFRFCSVLCLCPQRMFWKTSEWHLEAVAHFQTHIFMWGLEHIDHRLWVQTGNLLPLCHRSIELLLTENAVFAPLKQSFTCGSCTFRYFSVTEHIQPYSYSESSAGYWALCIRKRSSC